MTETGGRVRIGLLGGFAIAIGEREVDEAAWPGRRAVELVQILALSERHELLRDQVVEALWPHLDPKAGASNLRKAAHHVRQALEDEGAVVLRRGSVALFPGREVDVDVEVYERAAAEALVSADGGACGRVADTWNGDLLPGSAYEEWTQSRRLHLRRLQSDLLRTAGRWVDLVALDPTDEAPYQELMRQALDEGARAAAIRWYGQLRNVLASDLGVTPDERSQALYARCLEGVTDPPRLFGRAVELATVEAMLADESRVRFGAVAVSGPAGIGKSALCREIVRSAERHGWSSRYVRVEEGSPAYAPVAACIDDVVLDGRDLLDDVDRHARSVLAALTPSARPADPLDGPLSRHQLIGALQQLLASAAHGRRVLVVVDDAHLADDATLDALSHMACTVRNTVIVFSHRDISGQGALERARARMDRAGALVKVDLGPLDPDDVAVIVRQEARRELADEVVDQIVERAGGNPFVAAELARSDAPHQPSTLTEVIVDRLVDVDADTMAVLQRVAIVADDLDSATVVALTGDTEEAACAVLDRALESGVLVVGGSRYRFRHDFVRQALVEQVPPHQRAAVHRDVAQRLAAVGAAAATVARHWMAGNRPGEAVGWLLTAASDAMRLGAFADARRHVAAVLEHEPTHPRALRLDAESLDMMGHPAALAAYDEAIRVADDVERHDLVAARALAQLKQGDPPGALRAIEGTTPTSVAGRLSEALTYAGAAALGFADPSVGSAKAAECRRLALQSGDSAAIVVASWAQAAAAHARGELHESVLEDLRDTRDVPHLAARVFDGQLCITQRFLYGSRPYDDVIAFADRLADEGARLGAARGHAFGITLRGEAELLSDRLDDARRDLTEGGRLHRSIGGATGEALALQRLAELSIRRGELESASSLLADALDVARATDIGFHLLDRIYGTRIDLAADAEEVMAAVEEAEEAVRGPLETCPGCRITFAVPAAIACARGGHLERAHAFAEACEFLAHVVMRLPAWDAAYEEVRGHVARAEGDERRARRRFAAAFAGFGAAGQPWDRDRCAQLMHG